MTNVPENMSYVSFHLLSEVLALGQVDSFLADWEGLTLQLFPSIAHPFPAARSPNTDRAATLQTPAQPLESKGLEVNHYETTDFPSRCPSLFFLLTPSSGS